MRPYCYRWSSVVCSLVCWPDCKPEGPLFSAEFVCLCVCLWPALLPFNVDRFWWHLVTRTLLWSSLAAIIMVQIGRATPSWKFQKFSKITEFEFQNSGSWFFASVSPVYCKKIGFNSNKTDGWDRFWSLLPWRFRQWHCCSSTTLVRIYWLNWQHGGVQRSKLGGIPNWGVMNWGRNRVVKTNRLVCHDCEPCKNGSTNRYAARDVDSGRPKEPCIRWGLHIGATRQIWQNRPCVAAMQSYVKTNLYKRGELLMPRYQLLPLMLSVFD